jgi:hypothetical protein
MCGLRTSRSGFERLPSQGWAAMLVMNGLEIDTTYGFLRAGNCKHEEAGRQAGRVDWFVFSRWSRSIPMIFFILFSLESN